MDGVQFLRLWVLLRIWRVRCSRRQVGGIAYRSGAHCTVGGPGFWPYLSGGTALSRCSCSGPVVAEAVVVTRYRGVVG
jgi:hypothetical protein